MIINDITILKITQCSCASVGAVKLMKEYARRRRVFNYNSDLCVKEPGLDANHRAEKP